MIIPYKFETFILFINNAFCRAFFIRPRCGLFSMFVFFSGFCDTYSYPFSTFFFLCPCCFYLYIYIILSLTASIFLWLLFAAFCFRFSFLPFVGFFIGDCFSLLRFQNEPQQRENQKNSKPAGCLVAEMMGQGCCSNLYA